MPWKGVKIMTKENLLDRHIHLHSHEILVGHGLRLRGRIHSKVFSSFFWKVLPAIGIVGALWFRWWR
jgi:hypothetical protein